MVSAAAILTDSTVAVYTSTMAKTPPRKATTTRFSLSLPTDLVAELDREVAQQQKGQGYTISRNNLIERYIRRGLRKR